MRPLPISIPSPSDGTLEIGPLSIHAYGLMIALGVVAGVWLTGRRLEAKGATPVGIERFRPNIVIDDIDAHGEDFLESLSAPDYAIRLVKRCARCAIPDIDPATAAVSSEPTETLMAYRLDEAAGGVTFGMNAIVTRGADEAVVRVGDVLESDVRFD